MGLLFFPLVIAAMWFLMIRPQQQRVRNQRALVVSLEEGQEVITAGGLIGTITAVRDRDVTLDLGGGIEVRVLRTAVSMRLPAESPGPVEED
ncbi:MAG: yajC [Actinomycetia bacterium]|nr:yajC [Actinomycetes bacterium]